MEKLSGFDKGVCRKTRIKRVIFEFRVIFGCKNDDNNKNNNPEVKYRVITNYANTFSKNHILSTIVNLMAFVDEKIEYRIEDEYEIIE